MTLAFNKKSTFGLSQRCFLNITETDL